MLKDESARPVKRVRVIEQKSEPREEIKKQYRQLRVLAYCRVSTKQEEQLNSYETQKNYYTELINKNPDWKLIKIFADKGITGTSVKKRDEFNKMIRLCKQGKADMIIIAFLRFTNWNSFTRTPLLIYTEYKPLQFPF